MSDESIHRNGSNRANLQLVPEYNPSPTQAYLAEEALLGCIIIAPEVVLPDLTWFHDEMFASIKNQWVYQAAEALYKRGDNIDSLTLINELRIMNVLQEIGGPSYLTYLSNQVANYMNYITYALDVQEAWRSRRVMFLSGKLADAAAKSRPYQAQDTLKELHELFYAGYTALNPLEKHLHAATDLKKLPTYSFLIPGEIPERGIIALFGPSGVGKSFQALDYALRIAQSRTVIYVAAEGQSGYQQRVEAWCNHNGLTEGHLYFYLKAVSLLSDSQLEHFVRLLTPLSPALIIIDTMAHCILPGDENNTRDMGTFIEACNAIIDRLNCAILLVHHTGKNGGAERGSSSLRAACDIMIRMVDEDEIIAIECSKTKDAEAFPTRYVRLLPVATGRGFSPVIIDAKKVHTSPNDPPTPKQAKLLRALAQEVFADGASQTELAEAINVPSGNVYNVLNRMISRGFVAKRQGLHPWQITESGKAMLVKMGLLEPPTTSNYNPTTQKLQPETLDND